MENYIMLNKYFGEIFGKLKILKNSQDSFFLKMGKEHKSWIESLLQKCKGKIENFDDIFKISSQLTSKSGLKGNDARVWDLIGELWGAEILIDNGFTKIKYQKNGVDFICYKNNTKHIMEVKFIRGPSYKRQKQVLKAYQLIPNPEINKIKDKIMEALEQLNRKNKKAQKILFLTSLNDEFIPVFVQKQKREELSFEREIKNFIKGETKKHKIKIFFKSLAGIYLFN